MRFMIFSLILTFTWFTWAETSSSIRVVSFTERITPLLTINPNQLKFDNEYVCTHSAMDLVEQELKNINRNSNIAFFSIPNHTALKMAALCKNKLKSAQMFQAVAEEIPWNIHIELVTMSQEGEILSRDGRIDLSHIKIEDEKIFTSRNSPTFNKADIIINNGDFNGKEAQVNKDLSLSYETRTKNNSHISGYDRFKTTMVGMTVNLLNSLAENTPNLKFAIMPGMTSYESERLDQDPDLFTTALVQVNFPLSAGASLNINSWYTENFDSGLSEEASNEIELRIQSPSGLNLESSFSRVCNPDCENAVLLQVQFRFH